MPLIKKNILIILSIVFSTTVFSFFLLISINILLKMGWVSIESVNNRGLYGNDYFSLFKLSFPFQIPLLLSTIGWNCKPNKIQFSTFQKYLICLVLLIAPKIFIDLITFGIDFTDLLFYIEIIALIISGLCFFSVYKFLKIL